MRSKYELLKHFAKLGFKVGAEIGVAQGSFSEAMFKAIPGLDLTCVDAWTPYDENRWGGSLDRNSHHFGVTLQRLSKYNAKIIRKFSMEAVKEIIPESLDFVYIDACHAFDFVMQDLIEWSKRVRKGGIVSGDDYYKFKGAGVIEAVDAYTKAHGIKFELTDPLTDKIQDRGSQEQPSFYWTKV
jgi:hypothetical protein